MKRAIEITTAWLSKLLPCLLLCVLLAGCPQIPTGDSIENDDQALVAWPGGDIQYSIVNDITPDQAQRIRQYMVEIETACKGAIAFYEKTKAKYDAADGRHILAIYAAGDGESRATLGFIERPWFEVGRDLALSVEPSVIKHELFHVLGFRHELQRPDRDQYVTIHMENIRKDKLINFKIYGDELYDIAKIPYDPDSISNYGYSKYSFCIEARPVMEFCSCRPQAFITDLSAGDVAKVLAVYGDEG
jgi:hypothetical protein